MHLDTSSDGYRCRRHSGILVHPTSFPSPYGIGDFGESAYEFIDFLAASGQHLWQILPMVPVTTFGNSPYQGYSAFAGEPMLISLSLLQKNGLLAPQDLYNVPDFDPVHVDYERVRKYKYPLLSKAHDNFLKSRDPQLLDDYEAFCSKNAYWLDDYCLFMAILEKQDGAPWTSWPEGLRNLDENEKPALTLKLSHTVSLHKFMQFIFNYQWTALKKYANDKGIAIVGDIPLFVSPEGADVWSDRELFEVDEKGYPSAVAGVPPDYFSATGQKWGNPLYDWEVHRETGYSWWVSRVRHELEHVDYLRIDHFRGLEAYWKVPVEAETAIEGQWEKGPGIELFRAIHDALGEDLPIFAEDLGIITPEVEKLRDGLGFPGMRILQFAFEGGDSTFLPHRFNTQNCICYTGTHDNNTSAGWYAEANEYCRDRVRRYMNTDASSISWDFIRTAMGTIANYCIFPLQDVLKLGSEARMNRPGVAEGNWSWRYRGGDLNDGMAQGLRQMTELYGRL